MADTLHKKQQSLYYFLKDSGLELDFLVGMKGECVPLEVKAKTAQAKSVQTVLKHADKYHVKHIIKFGDYNVGREGCSHFPTTCSSSWTWSQKKSSSNQSMWTPSTP